MTTERLLVRYRKDGWPLCPRCEEDELYNHVGSKPPYSPNIPLVEYFAEPFRCYYCNWEGTITPSVEATL